jgi:predicted RND superfamily exporter protein
MERLAWLIVKRRVALFIVISVLALGGVGAYLSANLPHEDDILAFLPAQDPDVQLFHELSRRFGSLDVALVGIRGDDVLAPAFLRPLKGATDALRETKGLDQVMSVTNVIDFAPDPVKGGIITGPLVPNVPGEVEGAQALRRKIISRDHVWGNLVAPNGKAVLIYCFLAHGTDPKEVGPRIKKIVGDHFPRNEKFWGGGPFIASYIYTSTQADMRRLTPWAVLAMIVVMMVAFRDILGTCLALLSTSFGIVFSMGLMALLGYRVNLVLGSMPVILFAVSSGYGIHVLARYYSLARQCENSEQAIVKTLVSTGPNVVAAGLTTVVSMFSFMTMDLVPMRVFGFFTGFGVLATLILSLVFIPAVIRLVPLRGPKRAQDQDSWGTALMIRITAWCSRHRRPAAFALLLIAALAGVAVSRVESRIEPTNLFAKDSPPARAEAFLTESFGGAHFLQLQVNGDMTDPALLRRVQWMADRLQRFPRVASVTQIGDALSRANEAMEGQRRIPDTAGKVKLLYSLTASDPAIGQLITPDYRYALIHVKAATATAEGLEALLGEVEHWIKKEVNQGYRIVSLRSALAAPARAELERQAGARIESALALAGLSPTPDQLKRVSVALGQLDRAEPIDTAPVARALQRYLRTEECAIALPPAKDGVDPAAVVAAAVAALGPRPREKALQAAVGRAMNLAPADGKVDELIGAIETSIKEIWRNEHAQGHATRLLAAAGLQWPTDRARARALSLALKGAVLDLQAETVLLPANDPALAGDPAATRADTLGLGTFMLGVSGVPVINRALSRSALANQISSLSFALVPVLLIMSVLFRSIKAGLLVSVPTLLTLLLIYGGMGLLGLHLDIGTAMLACIILGAGVDYAVHLVAEWRCPRNCSVRDAAIHAVRRTSSAIWLNALMVCIGFAVLTMGEARPLQNVGGLTAVAMLTAAAATFLAIPVLANKTRYGRSKSVSEQEVHAVPLVQSENSVTQRSVAGGNHD